MRTTVVCKCKAPLRRRDGDVKLVEHVAGSCDRSAGTEWRFAVGALPRVCQLLDFGRTCVSRQSQPPPLGGTVLASQNSVLGQERLVRASALARPGVVIVARKCKSTYVSTSRWLENNTQV